MNYYNEIKTEILNNEITKRVKDYSKNKSDLTTYYNVGKLLSEAGKHYGEGIIKEYSEKLSNDLKKKYSTRLLYKMLKFYNYCDLEILPTMSAKLTQSHFDELLSISNKNIINYYIKVCENNNLSVRQLRKRIKNKEYERLDEQTKLKLIKKEKLEVQDAIKNPIIISNKSNYEIVSEKVLQKLILEDIPAFLDELGNGFTFGRK